MSKKLVSLALVLMLLVTGVVYATVGPSKQTGDMTESRVVAKNGVEVKSDFAVETKGETDFSKEVFEEIAAFVKDESKAIIDYFPAEVIKSVEAMLPAGVKSENLSVNEFMPLDVKNYDSAYGEMTIAFKFPTKYEPDQAIVAMVGAGSGDEIEWTALPAEVNEDGEVEITFTEETMEQIGEGDAVLAILSETAEAAE